MAPEPPQPDQTPKYSLTGGGGYNPQIQGDTRVYGEGLINMGSFCGGGGMGLLVLILGLFGIVWAYFYLVRKGARLRSRPRTEPGVPGIRWILSQIGSVCDGEDILESAVSGGGGMVLPRRKVVRRRGMGLPRILILGSFGIVCAYFYLAVQTEWFKLEIHWNPFGVPLEPPQPTL